MKKILLLASVFAVLTGCSAQLALHGNSSIKEPQFILMHKGQSKAIIESQPIKSTKTEVLENGNFISTYKYKVGAGPSTGRAVVYVVLDALTFFISELVTFPYEKQLGDWKEFKIEYTPEGKVIRIL